MSVRLSTDSLVNLRLACQDMAAKESSADDFSSDGIQTRDEVALQQLSFYQPVQMAGVPGIGVAIQVAPAVSALADARELQACFPLTDAWTIIGTRMEDFPECKKEQLKLMRKALFRVHPDKGGDADAFRVVEGTFEMLMDESRRRFYNKHGWPGGFRSQVREGVGVGVVGGG